MALTVCCYRYDTTQALLDGTAGITGYDATYEAAPTVIDVFERMLTKREFDVAELGLTYLLRSMEDGDRPFVALPVFPNRIFRHSCVFVNRHSGIRGPEDLVGRTIGEFGMYGQDSGIWAKGALSDDHGFDPAANRWLIGGLNEPMPPFPFTSHPRPAGVDIREADDALATMLADGRIDALFTANVPQNVLDGTAPDVVRLFPDYPAVERDYYRRTGIFPMMHTVVMPRDLAERQPELVRATYDAFVEARAVAMRRYAADRRIFEVSTMIPWVDRLFEENRELFGADWWPPYGFTANRSTLDTFLRYSHEQGLTSRRWTPEELFTLLES
ncbi:hypothetical protein [Kribbella sp.]|uniref:hypothetical protein n=1 Tax=Kribbella sp. TaxID=1871183 RepID=UPI002D5CD628|nr:hypothetical protein [Kribbella sp.]HZX03149.1 hypothetical protein [Kribbella sp.]